ncbi:MAG: FAD-dependent monooxygenase [Cyclobacteriaceae bacterium]
MDNKDITILGAGLVGSLLSSMLAKEGFDVNLYEKRDDPRERILDKGRSINLALSHRGIKALKRAGAFEKVAPLMIPMKGRMIHDLNDGQTFQPYGQSGECIHSISRDSLNKLLIQHAEEVGAKLNFKRQIIDIDLTKNEISFLRTEKKVSAEVLIGADGAFSQLRKSMLKAGNFSFTESTLKHGYKELNIRPTKDGDFALAPNYLHIWPRKRFMLIALPNIDRSFTCTLFLAFDGETSFEKLDSDQAIIDFFEKEFKGVHELIPDLVEQFNTNPTSSLVTIKTSPWHKGNAMLIGDACHAIVPFYGQGMNAGFEDCTLFLELGKKMGFDWERLMPYFSKIRKKDVDAISDLAMSNFVEMRDRVVDDQFIKQKKLEARLQQQYPDLWTPLYSMVTFSDTPYSEALRLGKLQEQIIKKLPSDYDPETQPLDKIIAEFNALAQVSQRE